MNSILSKQPILSICIPTYNRERFLQILLKSIISQANPNEVEIVVSDNASTDGTADLIKYFSTLYRNITYVISPENLGADRNYLNCVNIASGEYCWLMGSDDALRPKSITKILELLKSRSDIYLTGRIEASYQLEPIRNRLWLDAHEPSQCFDFSREGEILRYLRASRSLGALFSYLSSIVVKRSSWNTVTFDESFIGTAYSHAYILFSMVLNGCRLHYVTDPLVLSRSGNDSFFTDWTARALLDFNGYKRLKELIKDQEISNSFTSVMRHEYKAINIIKCKILSNSEKWNDLRRIAIEEYKFNSAIFLIANILHPIGRFFLKIRRISREILRKDTNSTHI